jgi:hypothetical protein
LSGLREFHRPASASALGSVQFASGVWLALSNAPSLTPLSIGVAASLARGALLSAAASRSTGALLIAHCPRSQLKPSAQSELRRHEPPPQPTLLASPAPNADQKTSNSKPQKK